MKIFIINKISFQELNISMDISDNRKILNKLSSISNLFLLFRLSSLLNKSNNQISSRKENIKDIILL
jgi:hypothetical protein